MRCLPTALHAGVNEVAIRVTDLGGGGGIARGCVEKRFVQPNGEAQASTGR